MVAPLPVHQAPATSKSPNPRRWRRRASTRSCADKGDHYDRCLACRASQARSSPSRSSGSSAPTVSCRRRGTPPPRSPIWSSSASGRACGRSRRAKRSSRSPATSSSTRSATSRCSSCGRRTARSARSTTRACTAARASRRARVRSRTGASSARTTGGSTRSTARSSGSSTPRSSRTFPTGSRCARCASTASAASCSSTSTAMPKPLLDFLDPLPTLLAPYHLERMRLRSYRTTIIDANWKAVVDAFNEGYHVQGLHPQILPWTDDVSIEYEQLGTHAHYGRLPGARRALRPSPRLGLAPDEYDEGEILAGLVAGLGWRVPRGRARRGRRTARVRAARPVRRCSRRTKRAAGSCCRRAASTRVASPRIR